jgi:tRNA pseudouridine38-40 synthase
MERFTRTHFVHRPSFIDTNEYDEPYAITLEDIQRLKSIFKLYEGTHDFGAFGGQLEQNAKKRNDNKPINTIRTVYKAELVKEPNYRFGCYDPFEQQHGFIGEEGNYRIDFLLKGALYKMVRNMVGTAIEVWLGRMTEEQLVELLQIEQDQDQRMDRRDNPCKPAPPEGLTLECVYYDDGF